MKKTAYYLTGMGGRLDTGLGEALMSRGLSVTGRELVGDFRKLTFENQVALVRDDILSDFWTSDSLLIANSFGAYLFLHAQAQLEPYIGNVILLSPIIGSFYSQATRRLFIPPFATKLTNMAELGKFPTPQKCQIHVGSEDWQSNPEDVTRFGELVGLRIDVVPGAGHMLPREYVGNILDKWCA